MLSIKTALRRPIVSLLGILLVVSMTAFLSVGIGQAIMAKDTLNSFENNFTTVALISGKFRQDYRKTYKFGDKTFSVIQRTIPEEISNWLDSMTKEHPDIVKDISSPGLASAYIPDLEVDFYTDHPYEGSIVSVSATAAYPRPYGMPYNCVVLEFKLSEIGDITTKETNLGLVDNTRASFETETFVQLKGVVTTVVECNEGYGDLTNRSIILSVKIRNPEALENLDLKTGEKYLVFTNQFIDRIWKTGDDIVRFGIGETFTYDENVYYLHEDGTKTPLTDTSKTYIDENGETVTCTAEEYLERYSLPVISHVADGLDAFLASEAGAEWRAVLECMKINEHAFPVVGLQKLGYLAHFARGSARIVEGRDFSSKELEGGKKVCIISESLAAKNGISVGDTIDMNYYIYDLSIPYQDYIGAGKGIVEPTAYYYTSTTGLTDKETYKVIGLYRDDAEWSYVQGDLYAFTPNTIFVPESSVTGSMDYSDQGFFKTYVLENGTIDEFTKIVALAGYDELFVCYDQGYSVITNHLYEYNKVAMRALAVGISSSLVIAVLYFILFPMQQKKNVSIMYSLGASRKKRMSYLLSSNLCILLPGTLLGCVLSIVSCDLVSRALFAEAEVETYLDFAVGAPFLIFISAIQFVCIFALVVILAPFMTRDRKMSERK